MPSTPAKRTKMTKSTTKRARAIVPSANRRTLSIPRGIFNRTTGFPKQLTMKHKYVEPNFVLTSPSTGTTATTYLFVCNGLFDPNQTGTGHQPMYFDNLSAIYNHYTVIASKIKVTAMPVPSSTGTPVEHGTFGIYIEDDVAQLSTATAIMENPSAHYKAVNKDGKIVVSHSWDSKQYFGGNTMDNDDLRGNAASLPVERSYYCLFATTQALKTVDFLCNVEIEYTAVWNELIPLTEQ